MTNNLVKVYIYKIKHDYLNKINWFNKYRLLQIKQCFCNLAKQQKIYSWLLINYALQKEFKDGFIEQENFRLINNSFWKYKNYFFSITHRNEYIAISISMQKIGIDLELFNKNLFTKAIWNRINNEHKNLEYSVLSCLFLWIKKEAFFKQMSPNYFLKLNKKKNKKITILNLNKTKIWLAVTCNRKNIKLLIDI